MFKARKIGISVSHDYVAVLFEKDAKMLSLSVGDRIKVFTNVSDNDKNFVICKLEIINDNSKNYFIEKGEIGLYESAFDKICYKENVDVNIVPAKKPMSLMYVKNKFEGKKLKKTEIFEILKDIVDNRYSSVETTYFVLACSAHPLNDDETIYLTEAMVNVGKYLDFKNFIDNGIIVDKHCIGGVPGNRTTMIVVPIVAAAGILIPKTSSRSITSPSGTADTMEVISNVDLSLTKMYQIVKELKGCVIWGGSLDLSPADDLIINVEHPLDIDSEGQMIASILSKKKSAGSTHVLIDIPYGKNAKVETKVHAKRLKRRFEKIGSAVGLKVEVMLSDGSSPVGSGIGPFLESVDVLKVLKNEKDLPVDLKEKSLYMAGKLIEMGGQAKQGKGYDLAKSILETGIAYEKFCNIVKMQGEKQSVSYAKYSHSFKARETGNIVSINNKHISHLAFILGAPNDKSAGVYLKKKVGEHVKKGEVLFKVYSNSQLRLDYGLNYILDNKLYDIE